MGQPGAKMGDPVVGTDTHIVMIPSPGGPGRGPGQHLQRSRAGTDLDGAGVLDGADRLICQSAELPLVWPAGR